MKIGSVRIPNQLVLAPMLGINCPAFRLMCHNFGAGLVCSPMLHSLSIAKLVEDGLLNFTEKERPRSVQIIGREHKIMAESAKLIEEHADIIDINFGCPDSDVLEQKMGAFFSKHPEQMSRIISAVAGATNKPVTAKIRIGWDSKSLNHVKSAKIAEDSGAAAVAVHARTAQQGYSGKADWAAIRQVKEKVNIPVIGNGDVWSAEDAQHMLESTGCDFVMIGRGCKGNPYLFKQCDFLLNKKKRLENQTDNEKGRLILDFIRLYNKVQKIKRFPELRQHAIWLCAKTKGAARKKQMLLRTPTEKELVKKVKALFRL